MIVYTILRVYKNGNTEKVYLLERDNFGVSFKIYEGSIKDGQCENYLVENRDE